MTVHQDEHPATFASGAILDGRYRLEERIGWGGMGEIYRGRHLMMNQDVAVKLLRPELAGDPLAAKRFAREARSTFRIDHAHCVRVTDFGATADGVLFLVMEYLRGRTVGQELLVDGPLAPRRVVHIARQLCDALAHAHDLGFVHRDLKPANIMLIHRDRDPDFVKVLDFGLAKLFDAHASGMTYLSLSPLTRHGMVFGTAEYVSPEQATGQPLSPASDVYSAGITLYEMLCGCLPFQGATFTEVLTRHVTEHPVPPSARRPDLAIPPALEALVMDCMAKPVDARPPGIRSVSERLAAIAAALDAQQRPGDAQQRPGGGQRPPLPASASATIDLDASPEATLPLGGSPPADPLVAPRVDPLARTAGLAAPAPVHTGPPAPTASVRVPARPGASARPRRPLVAGGLLVAGMVLAGVSTILALQSRARTGDAGITTSERGDGRGADAGAVAQAMAPAASPAPGHIRAPAADAAPPTGASAPVSDPSSAPASASAPASGPATAATPAAPVPSASPGTPDPRPARPPDAQQQRLQQHLEAAETARRQGNRLKQLAEADSALRIAPSSAHAAFLLGDALLHSGDKATACKYLHRARRRASARAAYRRAGCSGD